MRILRQIFPADFIIVLIWLIYINALIFSKLPDEFFRGIASVASAVYKYFILIAGNNSFVKILGGFSVIGRLQKTLSRENPIAQKVSKH